MSLWDEAELLLGIAETWGARWPSTGFRSNSPEMGETHHPVVVLRALLWISCGYRFKSETLRSHWYTQPFPTSNLKPKLFITVCFHLCVYVCVCVYKYIDILNICRSIVFTRENVFIYETWNNFVNIVLIYLKNKVILSCFCERFFLSLSHWTSVTASINS